MARRQKRDCRRTHDGAATLELTSQFTTWAAQSRRKFRGVEHAPPFDPHADYADEHADLSAIHLQWKLQ